MIILRMPRGNGLIPDFPPHHAEYQSRILAEETRQPIWHPGLADMFMFLKLASSASFPRDGDHCAFPG
jgi:hypothetical protein